MRTQITFLSVAILGAVAALAAGPLGAAPQASAGFAVIDNLRVFEESNQGRAANQEIQANLGTWQAELETLQTEVQTLLTQRQQQGSVMTPEALDELNQNIEEKQLELQRRREDAQRQAAAIRDRVLVDLENMLTPVVAELATELGYSAVLNSQTPGLLHYDASIDITDELIARLNAMNP